MTDSEEEQRRKFAERLSDWSEPGAITIIRNGVALDNTVVVDPVAEPTVVGVDDDGNLFMSDGTVRVP